MRNVKRTFGGVEIQGIVGSVYEHNNHRSKDFPLFTEQSHFTDDTILTIATAHARPPPTTASVTARPL